MLHMWVPVANNLVERFFALLLQIKEANFCVALDVVVDEPQITSILNS